MGVALKLKSNMALVKTEGELLRLDAGREDITTQYNIQVLFHCLLQ